MKPHICIIGSSFAGLSTYLVLKKRLGDNIKITLIDKREQFCYIPSLHEALYKPGFLQKIQFELKDYYSEFLKANISKITANKKIITQEGEEISFDYAVIATGSRTNYFGKEDFEKNTYAVRWANDIEPLNKKLESAKHICVVGGGFTGLEIAGTIAIRKKAGQTVTLVHSQDRLVDTYDPKISHKAQMRMIKHKVDVVLSDRAEKIQENKVILSSGKQINSDCTILSTGIKINDEQHVGQLDFQTYISEESGDIYMAGDVALHGLATTAHNAMIEGRRIGHLIADNIEGIEKNYPPLESRTTLAMALGPYDGIITNGKRGQYIPYFHGLAKKIIEKRILFEFKHKIMLWV